MRVRTAHESNVKHVGQVHVIYIQSLPREQARVFVAFDPLAEISSCHKFSSPPNSPVLEIKHVENWRIRELRPCHRSTKRCLAAFELPGEHTQCNPLVMQFLRTEVASEIFH